MNFQSFQIRFNLNNFVEGYLEWLNGPKFKSICRGYHLKEILKTLYQIRTTNFERRLRTLEATDGQASVRHLFTSEMSEEDIEVIVSKIPPDAPTEEQLTQFLAQVRYLLKPCLEKMPLHSQLTWAGSLNFSAEVPYELEAEWDLSSNR